ncbi:hypothetical protein M9Y10_021266 [Tritrichomonas musculus]|uniref:Uncharacterized protein n=1 Tax=Tritrichomonas musculus TaxID=1915356 RepID=A0ABR2HEK0_9EUKA
MSNNSKHTASLPDYTYKPQRWNGFLTDIKLESISFKKIMSEVTQNKDKSNADFEKFSKESFASIRRASLRNNDQQHQISRLSASSRLNQTHNRKIKNAVRRSNNNFHTQEQQSSPFEFDIRISNHDRWPKRPSSARRILRPVKLQDYPDLERPKDIICVMGAPLDPLVPI